MKAFRIVQWHTAHETPESRKYMKLSWVAKPNKHDGLGYRQIVRQGDKNDLYAGWNLILEVASKAPRDIRGWLIRNGKALTPLDLELMTGFPEGMFARCLEFYSGGEMGWLIEEEFTALPAARPGHSSPASGSPEDASGRRLVHDSTEQYPVRSAVGNKKGAAGRVNGTRRSGVSASKVQWAALNRRIKELEGRGEEMEAEEREELAKKRGELSLLEEKQRAGDFS